MCYVQFCRCLNPSTARHALLPSPRLYKELLRMAVVVLIECLNLKIVHTLDLKLCKNASIEFVSKDLS